ncbi:MAG: hypothetical protein Q7U34_02715 [Anaerolineales bacterium]|nr:hypothetical protein [Anaerolineales bacterium]MDO9349310.1 hypothetical protein [Anaerolineales bacterium]
MTAFSFYVRIVKTLDEIGAPYMIVGAFGGYPFGISRVTYDIDILVDLHEQDFDALSQAFPLPRYYADPEMMRNSVAMGIMFNIIDTGEGVKADLVPLKREPEYQVAFERRIRRKFTVSSGETFEAWVAQPTDIIIGKLHAWDEGRSLKHPNDILSILVFCLSGLSEYSVDTDIVTTAAARIGQETLEMWNQLVARAQAEVQARDA